MEYLNHKLVITKLLKEAHFIAEKTSKILFIKCKERIEIFY